MNKFKNYSPTILGILLLLLSAFLLLFLPDYPHTGITAGIVGLGIIVIDALDK